MHKARAPFFFAVLFFLTVPPAYSQAPPDDPNGQIQTKLTQIEERIKKIEKDQQEVLVQEGKILEELIRLRFMIRRS